MHGLAGDRRHQCPARGRRRHGRTACIVIAGHAENHVTIALLLFGGPLLYLLAQSWYLRRLTHTVPRARLLGAVALVLAGVAAVLLPPTMAVAPLTVTVLGITVLAALELVSDATWATSATRSLWLRRRLGRLESKIAVDFDRSSDQPGGRARPD